MKKEVLGEVKLKIALDLNTGKGEVSVESRPLKKRELMAKGIGKSEQKTGLKE